MEQAQLYSDLSALCAVPSVSGSEGERAFPEALRRLLQTIPYFQSSPEQISLFPVEGGGGTQNLFALMRAKKNTRKTILLLSHYDVVGVAEYGAQGSLAFSPEEYTAFLHTGGISLPAAAQADLDSGDFLFGRGVCDMKWGIAADLSLLRYYGAHPNEQPCNLLMVCVPDEEANSTGMLSAVGQLVRFRAQQGLDILCCVVGEPDISPEQGRTGRPLHVGAAGKLMPLYYCAGLETHVGEPFRGLNPNLVISEIVSRMELSADWIDCANGCYTPAPVCLKQSDLKDAYSVQTPCAAYAYFNVMTLSENTPEHILRQMERTARAALDAAAGRIEAQRQAAEKKLGRPVRGEQPQAKVLRYGQLLRLCEQAHGAAFTEHMARFLQQSKTADLRQLTVELVREAHSFCPDRSPMVILCFAPPYYPHSGFLPEQSGTVRACRALAREIPEESFFVDFCFNGLTDMCYLSLHGQIDPDELAHTFPAWGARYRVPLDAIRALDIPFVNFGPLGRDPHKYTERLGLSYSLGRAPGYLRRLVELLSQEIPAHTP